MNPPPFHNPNAKITKNSLSPHLKINRDSRSIKKQSSPSPPSTLGLITGLAKPPPQPHRTPVIIYTHSPKIIHTDPKDFMALVQKLTGMSRSSDNQAPDLQVKREPAEDQESNNINGSIYDENESSSVITTDHENCGDGQVNSGCFVPPVFDPYMGHIPVFTPSSGEFLCANYQQYNNGYTDSLYFNNCGLRASISSSSSAMEAISDFPEY